MRNPPRTRPIVSWTEPVAARTAPPAIAVVTRWPPGLIDASVAAPDWGNHRVNAGAAGGESPQADAPLTNLVLRSYLAPLHRHPHRGHTHTNHRRLDGDARHRAQAPDARSVGMSMAEAGVVSPTPRWNGPSSPPHCTPGHDTRRSSGDRGPCRRN